MKSVGRKLGFSIGTILLVAAALLLAALEMPGAGADATAPKPAAMVAKPIPRAPAPKPAPIEPVDPEAYVIKRILDVPEPMRHGDHYWDEAGVPAGPLVITVDLAAQTLSAFRGGYEIGTATILYGADAKPTPLGVYPITQKDADHHSNLYGNAPMPYMLRLTNDGVSIHGTDVQDGSITHGCIGVPTPFARKLFAAAKLGDRVIVTRGEMLKQGAAVTAL